MMEEREAGRDEGRGVRRGAFLVASTAGLIVCLLVVALPESLIVMWRSSRRLSDSQAGWAYGLLIVAATAQALYSGYVAFSPSRARGRGPGHDPARLATSFSRNAASTSLLTLVYGSAALRITGERGGFWVFPLLALAQGAWLYRNAGLFAEGLQQGPSNRPPRAPGGAWSEPQDFTPPLARRLLGPDGS